MRNTALINLNMALFREQLWWIDRILKGGVVIPLIIPQCSLKFPQSSLGILRVPQLPPPLEHPPLKNPTIKNPVLRPYLSWGYLTWGRLTRHLSRRIEVLKTQSIQSDPEEVVLTHSQESGCLFFCLFLLLFVVVCVCFLIVWLFVCLFVCLLFVVVLFSGCLFVCLFVFVVLFIVCVFCLLFVVILLFGCLFVLLVLKVLFVFCCCSCCCQCFFCAILGRTDWSVWFGDLRTHEHFVVELQRVTRIWYWRM